MTQARFETTAEVDRLLVRLGSEDVAVPGGLGARTLARIAPRLRARRSERNHLLFRLTLAGALFLPLLLGYNAGVAGLVYLGLDRLLPPVAAAGAAVAFGGVLLLALSMAYGSLPILASVLLRLRKEPV